MTVLELPSRPILVTGAAGGIGRHLWKRIVEAGGKVVATDRDEAGLKALSQEIEVVGSRVADVSDPNSVRELARWVHAEHGPLGGLVNIAGVNRLAPLDETTDEDWSSIVGSNLGSAFFLCREFVPTMADNGGGAVVNTSSIFGLRGERNDAAYCAAKAGVIGLTKALALEFGPSNVRVNAIAPIVVLTDRVAKMPVEHLERQRARVPLGRVSSLDDVCSTYLFLLSRQGEFYNGQVLSPNGGDTMNG